jgi:hypothetical protein
MMQCLSHEEWFQKLFPNMAKANEDLKLHEATFLILVILFSKFQKVRKKKCLCRKRGKKVPHIFHAACGRMRMYNRKKPPLHHAPMLFLAAPCMSWLESLALP